MKAIALMTMFFLPATFISALWAVPALDKDDALTKENFGIYWVVTIPVTLVVFILYVLNNDTKLWGRIKSLSVFPNQNKSSKRSQGLEGRELSDLERGGSMATVPSTHLRGHSNSNQSGKSYQAGDRYS